MSFLTVPAGQIMLKRGGSINPAKYPNEVFQLLSIPSFDKGEPEITEGCEIGSSKICVEPSDVLLSKIVPHIRRCWVTPPKGQYRQIASGEWIVFRDNRFYPDFLKYFLTSDVFHRQFMDTVAGVGGSLVRARPAAVENIHIPIPPIPEQKLIAAILDKADSLRRKNRQAIQLADKFLRAVFLDMFGDPVTNPKGWKKGKITSVAEIITGHPFKSSEFVEASDDTVRLCRGANTLTGYFDWTDTVYWPKLKATDLEGFLIKHGDIILAMDRPWISSGLKVCVVDTMNTETYLVQRVARLRPIKPIYSEFIYACIKSKSFESHCCPTETTVPHISPIELKNFEIMLPDESKVKKFHEITRRIRSLNRNLEISNCKADMGFNSLSQKAFAGEL